MSSVEQVLAQMAEHDMPPLKTALPVLDGKYHRFGPGSKSWYILRTVKLPSGREAITGAFGRFVGEERNTVPVTIDYEAMSDEDKAEFARKMRQTEKAEQDKRNEAARLAAGRARDQWNKSLGNRPEHPYLERKQVTPEAVRISEKGELLVPMMRAGQIVGLQKIDAAGKKLYNTGMDKVGAHHVLGLLDGAPIIGIGEGYATCRSGRMACAPGYDFPVVVAFDAGGILPVATAIRAAHPAAHLLFLADDDYLVAERFIERLRSEFKVFASVPLDGQTHTVLADDGEDVQVCATWRDDAQGIAYLDTDVRKGRSVRTSKYHNAGVTACAAAVAKLGNASMVRPLFAERAGRKLTDFNDLHVEEGLEAVAAQIGFAILAAQQPKNASPVQAAPAAPSEAQDDGVAVGAESDATVLPPLPHDATTEPGDVPSWVDDGAIAPAPPPHPLEAAAEPEVTGLVSLAWALSHCSLIQGTTDVWDAINKLRMKSKAFLAMVGKENAKLWEAHEQRRTISPRSLPQLQRGVAAVEGGAGSDDLYSMLERYTLLYPTKTLYDHNTLGVVSVDAVMLSKGKHLTDRWLEHPMRREIHLDNLVFDPTQKVDLKTHINMFEGFPLKPKKDEQKARLVLELVWSLVETEAAVRKQLFHWVLCWLAYPLQHPGAKMQTAMLFFGRKQGTGKSLFFEGIVKPIYGKYGETGGQNQLDASYTMWRSQKLFVLFEEILSRQDKYAGIGLIKHMITGRSQAISQKFRDDRTEANHLNTVMLSNEFQAVPLEPDDRRFLVVDVRNDLSADLLARITSQLGDGLIEAFYSFLLDYPLGDFNPHTKPLMTDAKQRVISFGLPDWEAFYRSWSLGELDAPYCSCLSTDLFTVYDRYCSKYRLRGQSLTKFSELIGSILDKNRQWFTVGAKKKLLTVIHVPDQEGDDPEETLAKRCERFRIGADIKGIT